MNELIIEPKQNKQTKYSVLVMTDGVPEEILTFSQGIADTLDARVTIISKVVNKYHHGGFFLNLLRYLGYFTMPLDIIRKRNKNDFIIGWQQFYATNLAFYCKLLGLKKKTSIISANYTYKPKKGFVGKIYAAYMKFSARNKHLDKLHVLSHEAVKNLTSELNVDSRNFIVTPFGVEDIYSKFKDKNVADYENYAFSIGRSNRDFDFLVDVWRDPVLKDKLLIIASDQWKPKGELPMNVKHLTNLHGEEADLYQACCDINIVPIMDGNICSGDTVLLHAMMFERPVVVTTPSTLSEMYLDHGVNGLCLAKDKDTFAKEIYELLEDKQARQEMGKNARQKFIENFSQYSMGCAIANNILENI